jgi:[acyl-carrier-protein] S-malonyltransferase
LAEVCDQTGTYIVNINCPGQLVISGAKENLAQATTLAKDKGARRAIPLPVSGAFHTSLMQSAVDGMSQIIANLTFHQPLVPIIANTSAQPMTTAEQVKEELLRQLCHGVLWQRSIEYMINEGVSAFVEIGPGEVLSGLARRIDSKVKTINIGSVGAIRNLA